MRTLTIAMTLGLLSLAAFAQPTVTREVVDGQEWVVLDNGLLRLAVNPAERARIESLRYLPAQVDLLKRNLIVVKREPLLPLFTREEQGGAEDHFWGMVVQWKVKETRLVRAEIVEGAAVAETEGDHYGVTVRRRLTLRPGTLAAEIYVTLTNTTDKSVTHSYWFHAIPEISRREWAREADWRVPDEPELTVVPAAKKPGALGRGQPLWPERGTVIVDTAAYNTFFAPAQPWMAKWDPALRISLIADFRMQDMLPDGALFANRLYGVWPGRNTAELVFGTRTIRPGETHEYPLRILALPDSGPPLAISLSWALSGVESRFRLHALRSHGAATVEILTSGNELAGTFQIPPLAVGTHHDLDLAVGLKPGAIRLSTPGCTEVLELNP